MFDKNFVFNHCNLRAITTLTNQHLTIYGFASRQELRFSNDGCTSTDGVPAISSPLLLCIKSSRSRNRCLFNIAFGPHRCAYIAHFDDGLDPIWIDNLALNVITSASTTTAAAMCSSWVLRAITQIVFQICGIARLFVVLIIGFVLVIDIAASAAASTTTATTTATALGNFLLA